MKRAATHDEIKPLVEICKAGRLFDVQDWIKEGKPVNPPPYVSGGRRKSPLEIAMDQGFHSLVQVLLEGGADINDSNYCPLHEAIHMRRLDMVELIVAHGADIHSVEMATVFESWQPEIMKWFIERGADVETENPLAYALCHRIRTALGILKSYKYRFPSFQEQANIALRRHCWDGNLKWVSLMLWAGAEPYVRGSSDWNDEPDPEEDMSALEIAALRGNLDIFNLKAVQLDPSDPELKSLLLHTCHSGNCGLLEKLLEKGFDPAESEDKGTALIQSLLLRLDCCSIFDGDFFWRNERRPNRNLDSERARERIKMIHLLAKNGAKWLPENPGRIRDARQTLLKMKPDYTAEFIWIMSKYQASRREDLVELIRTPSIRAIISEHTKTINEMLAIL